MPGAVLSADEVTGQLMPLGLRWQADHGQASLSGPMLRLADDCDRAFRIVASAFGAGEERHPSVISAELLHRLDYFTSFPHQATFAACLDGDERNIRSFMAGLPAGPGGIRPGRLAPITAVLTPAACYHVYSAHEGEDHAAPRYFTTSNTCFRREAAFAPLTRQWGFTMREVICVGTAGEVGAFLGRARALAGALCGELGLPVTWEPATDPFFQPLTNPRYLLQKVAPTKEEAVLDGGLAVASVNLHHDHIGAAFGLTRASQAAHTGCLAFGLERWMYALITVHGTAPDAWPPVAGAAARAVAAQEAA